MLMMVINYVFVAVRWPTNNCCGWVGGAGGGGLLRDGEGTKASENQVREEEDGGVKRSISSISN